MKLDKWTALLPSQTSASQAGILHGNNSFIPAFRWWEKDSQRMLVSNHPDDAAEIVTRASNGEGLLSNDGASVGNLVTGDAVAQLHHDGDDQGPEPGPGPEPRLVLVLRQPGQLPARVRADDRRGHQGVLPGDPRRIGAASSRRCTAACPIPSPAPRPTSILRSLVDVAGHGGDVPRHAGHLRRLHRLRRDRPPLRPGARRDARRARRRRRDGAVAGQGRRGRAAAVPVRAPVGPRPEPRRDVPPALRQDPAGPSPS